MHDLSRTPCFSPSEMQNYISLVRRFSSAAGTSKWNQVRKFSTTSTLPWQNRQVADSFVSVFLLSRSSRGCNGNRRVPFGAWLLVRLLQPLLLYYSPLSFQPNSSLTIFSTSSALPLQTKTDTALLFLRRHLNLSCSMYCVINLVICFVTSYPRMAGLVNG